MRTSLVAFLKLLKLFHRYGSLMRWYDSDFEVLPSFLYILFFTPFWYKLTFVTSVYRMLFQNQAGP